MHFGTRHWPKINFGVGFEWRFLVGQLIIRVFGFYSKLVSCFLEIAGRAAVCGSVADFDVESSLNLLS
jgi:hypothetical protein